MRRIDPARETVIFEYLIQPKKQRMRLKDFLGQTGIGKSTFHAAQRRYYKIEKVRENHEVALKEKEDKKEQVQTILGDGLEAANAIDWLRGKTPKAVQALLKSAEAGNAQSLKLVFQLLGLLIEKSEQKVKLELSADEHSRIRNEARRRISEVCRTAD